MAKAVYHFSRAKSCLQKRIRPGTKQFLVLVAFLLSTTLVLWGQTGFISTLAGGGPNNLAAVAANIQPVAVVADAAGNYYIASANQNRVFRVSSAGTLTVAAGNGLPGFSGDGGAPTAAQLNAPAGLALDTSNNLYIADAGNNRIRKVTLGSSPAISTIAGSGTSGFGGDGGSPLSAQLSNPTGVALDTSGNLYVADQGNNRIRKITSGTSPAISTVAGNGTSGFSGDGGAPGAATLAGPAGVAADSSGNLYVADQGNNRIRKITFGTSPVINTVAGNGTAGFSGDGGSASAAQLAGPAGVAVDGSGNLYIADQNNNRVREVTAGGSPTIATVAGNGIAGSGGDGGAATAASLWSPSGIGLDGSGNVYIADTQNYRIRLVAKSSGVITTVAGNGSAGFSGDGLNPQCGGLAYPSGVVVDASGNVYIADWANNRIRKVTPGSNPTMVTIAGTGTAGFGGDGSNSMNAQFSGPTGLAIDGSGNLYIADVGNNRIRKITLGTTPVITTVVGNGTPGFSGDGGNPISAQLAWPNGVAVDSSGNLYISDSLNNRIRKVVFGATPAISTVVGSGTQGFSGDGGNPLSASLSSPTGVAVDGNGNLYIADYGNERIRKVTFGSNPTITTLAGTGAIANGAAGGAPTSTPISNPIGIAVDGSGNVYISELGNDRVREVSASTQSLITIAGNGTLDFSGDGSTATSASLGQPAGLALDSNGNLYVASPPENRIRVVAIGATAPPSGNTGNPPIASNLAPSGTLPIGTKSATLSLSTNEAATCAYSSSNVAYSSMTPFSNTGSLTHSTQVAGLANGQSYTYYVRCSDILGNVDTSSFVISFSVSSIATSPTVSAGPNQTITLPATATLSGTASPGSAGTLTTMWTSSGPAVVTFGNASALSTTVTFSQSGTYVLTLTATSGTLNASSNVTITVNPAVKPLTVSAGPNQTITLPSSATLSGTASGSVGTLTTIWTSSGPGVASFANASALNTTVSFPQSGFYILTLIATSATSSAVSNVSITVKPAPVSTPPTVSAGSNQTITLPSSATLSGTASPGSVGTVTVLWSLVSGPGTVTFANSTSASTTATFSQSGTYMLKLTATSGASSASSNVTITVNPASTGPTLIPVRVAAAGSYTDSQGNAWSSDAAYVVGTTSITGAVTNPIAGTSDPKLYQSERWQPSGVIPVHYQFPVPNGTYTLTMKFAELYWTAPGKRVFNIVVNGQTVIQNFDEFAAAGGRFTAVDRSVTVTVSTGLIDLQLVQVIDLPTISAIQILAP